MRSLLCLAALVPASRTLFIGGVFNSGPPTTGGVSHRADVPSPLAAHLAGEVPLASALNFRTATYYRKAIADDVRA